MKIVWLFSLTIMLITSCRGFYDDGDNYSDNTKSRRNSDALNNDSAYDEFPSFNTITNVAGLYSFDCMPCVCDANGFCSMIDTAYIINDSTSYVNLFKSCTSYFNCDTPSIVNFSTKTLIGRQLAGGVWINTAEHKVYYDAIDSAYKFHVRIEFDSGCAYNMMYAVKTIWATVPKLSASDTIIFEKSYYGKKCK